MSFFAFSMARRVPKGDVRRILIGIHHASGLLLETTHALTAFADDHALMIGRALQPLLDNLFAVRTAARSARIVSEVSKATAVAVALVHLIVILATSPPEFVGRLRDGSRAALDHDGAVGHVSVVAGLRFVDHDVRAGSILEFLDGPPARADGHLCHLRGDLEVFGDFRVRVLGAAAAVAIVATGIVVGGGAWRSSRWPRSS